VHLVLPFDLAVRGSAIFIADGERHQILHYDLARRRLAVYAGTGRTGTSGDGGPALKARLTEPTELAFDRAGNLYFSDVNQGRVRRIDTRGRITTVAKVKAAAGVSVHPSGGYLAIASIEGFVYRMPLPSGPLERLAGNGTQSTSGDGGPAADAALNGPHDATYDPAGNLYIGGYGHVRRIDAAAGTIDTAFPHDGFKVVAGPDGTLYLLTGDPRGGRITQVDATGKVLRRIGTGRGFLPSDVEPVTGAVLISQTQPFAAVRRLANGSSTLTTLFR
jgi:sugar lactone lactonase YvrE